MIWPDTGLRVYLCREPVDMLAVATPYPAGQLAIRDAENPA